MIYLSRLLRTFFHLLYHPFAWTYDLVAWVVSLGRWIGWLKSVTPYIKGPRVLELGHGPGHLQHILHGLNLLTIGLDESHQMGQLAKKRLYQYGYTQVGLVRGLAQALPFPSKSFDSIVASFPTEYFIHPATQSEVWRTLANGGRFIILPVAWITGTSLPERFAAWLFRVTGQAPSNFGKESTIQLIKLFTKAGFYIESEFVDIKSSRVLIVIATKK